MPLPKRTADEIAREPVVVLRVPDQGGFPEPGLELPRGLLLLSIVSGAKTDAGVHRARGSGGLLSLPPRPRRRPAPETEADAPAPESVTRRRSLPVGVVAVLLALAWIVWVLVQSGRLN